jgi:hypothetical protein
VAAPGPSHPVGLTPSGSVISTLNQALSGHHPLPAGAIAPGADWVGYGYRPFDRFIERESCTRPLFDLGPWRSINFRGKSCFIQEHAALTATDESAFVKTSQVSVESAVQELYAAADLGADFLGLFGGEVSAAYSSYTANSWEYRAAEVHVDLIRGIAKIDRGRDGLLVEVRAALAAACAAAPSNPSKVRAFLDTYGTHYIAGVRVGGTLYAYLQMEKSAYTSVEQMQGAVDATLAFVSGSASASQKSVVSDLYSSGQLHVNAYGGEDMPFDLSTTQLAVWQASVNRSPGVCGFVGKQGQDLGGLIPIHALLAKATTSEQIHANAAFVAVWNAYCEEHRLTGAGQGEAIVGLKTAWSTSATSAFADIVSAGYEIVRSNADPQDLNQGATPGPFDPHVTIYLGRKKGLSATPLTNLVVVAGSENVAAPTGYTRSQTDLNRGAGGQFIYLCSTNSPELYAPIREIWAESFDEAQTTTHFTNKGWIPVCEPGSSTPYDLNKGSHGKFIYLMFRR